MSNLGYLFGRFEEKTRSLAKANKITLTLWNELLRPIKEMSSNLNPNIPGFKDQLEYYQSHPAEWKGAIKKQLVRYNEEVNKIRKFRKSRKRSVVRKSRKEREFEEFLKRIEDYLEE